MSTLKANAVKELRVVLPEGIKYIRLANAKNSLRHNDKLKGSDITQETLDIITNLNLVDKASIKLNDMYWVTYIKPNEIVPKVFPRPITEDEIVEAVDVNKVQVISKVMYDAKANSKTFVSTPFDV